MKIPFTLDAWLKDKRQKVETRDGRLARIICWDRAAKEDQPKDLKLCVLVQEIGGESVYYYYSDGTKWVANDDYDLFIITPEPELTEFEKAVKDLCWRVGMGEVVYKNDIIKKTAAELLNLARKELEPEVLERLKVAYKTQYENGKQDGKAEALKEIEQDPESSYAFKRGVGYGKEEALKDLPKWEKCNKNTIYNTKFNLVENGVGRFLMVEGYQINIDSLEKLPGFNE